jgi:hypothetical protein
MDTPSSVGENFRCKILILIFQDGPEHHLSSSVLVYMHVTFHSATGTLAGVEGYLYQPVLIPYPDSTHSRTAAMSYFAVNIECKY